MVFAQRIRYFYAIRMRPSRCRIIYDACLVLVKGLNHLIRRFSFVDLIFFRQEILKL